MRRSVARCNAFTATLAAGVVVTAFGCSIYSVPDGPEGLESGGSSGSAGSGSSSDGGSNAAGGSKAGAGSGGVSPGGGGGSEGGGEGGSGGSEAGAGGSAGGAGGTGGSDGGSGGSAGSSGGVGGASGAGGGSVGGFAGSGFAGSGGGILELANNKPSTGSSEQPIHTYGHGNDGNTGTRWCAVVGTFPEHWRVDLGTSYELLSFEVRWEKGNSEYTYEVATSPDDITYTPQVTRSASGQLQTGSMMPGTIGRFVRINVTGATGNTWASFYEFKVFGRPLGGT